MREKDTVLLLNRPEEHFLESFYFAKTKSGIDAAVEGEDCSVVMATQDNRLPEALSPGGTAQTGVLNIAPHQNHPSLGQLKKEKIPAVLINCRSQDLSWVDVDNVRGASTMTEHLIRLGHEKILFVNGFKESQNSADRLRGFRATLEKRSLRFNPRMVINCDFSVQLSYRKMKDFLQANRKTGFTAVFASNDYMAVGVIRALADERIRVPEDVAVVGFDDFDFASSFYVPLTTYRQPFRNIGFLATKMLFRQMESRAARAVQGAELIGELVVRESCGARTVNR
ncbi:MAG: LacI family DNA-binding transcriptional regulator [Endomicrobiales bacterium]